ncbi:MAG: AAA family ATPase [Acidobacteria bacterium]|nr:AAA family ATPase [Pseudomonadota bacterium]MBS1867888.1 AAA family ATPase [Acidobacteriota bacterium]
MNARIPHLEEQAKRDLALVTDLAKRKHAPRTDAEGVFVRPLQVGAKLKSAAPIVKQAAELLNMDLQPIRWAVQDLIPEGVSLLVGAPKIGKSWLAMQFALSIVNGASVWNGRAPEAKGDVLMLALEDNDRRMQSRVTKLFAASKGGIESVNGLHYTTEWPRMDRDGLAHLGAWLDEHSETRLVIIDTLGRFRPPENGRGSAYQQDYEVGAGLKRIADQHKVALLLLHHTRKMAASDILDTVNATQGLAGSVDALLLLRRDRGQFDAALYVTGRDIEHEEDYALRFDEHSCTWSPLGRVHEAQLSRERRDILDYLASHGPSAPGEIAEGLGKNGGAIRRLLQKLLSAGDVKSDGKLYSLIHTYGNSGNNGNSGHDRHAGSTRVTPVTCVTAVTKGTAENDRSGVLEI